LIPAYCPGEALIALVQELKKNNMEIVIVNDGSDPSYEPIFTACECYAQILKQEPNQGKGAAMRRGMQWIQDNIHEECIVVTVDADGQHSPQDCLLCAATAQQHPDSLVLGIRDFNGPDVPFKSHWGNKITITIFQAFTKVRLNDTQTGLRAFHSSLIPTMLKIKGDRYEYEMNQLLAMVKEGIPFQEVLIRTIYEDNNSSSHFHVLRDSFLIYRQLFHFAASSLSSFFVDYILFALFSTVLSGTGSTLAANILARLFSATFNYEVNRKVVFKDGQSRKTSLWRYALLAAAVLALNTLILSFFVYVLGMNALIAKIITEILLFFSWSMQKAYVFHRPMKGVSNI
jgi:glycosyltransferase involved in cell wall biosynthesis